MRISILYHVRITYQLGFALGLFLGMSTDCYYTLQLGVNRNRSNRNNGYLFFRLPYTDSYSLHTDFSSAYTLIQGE